MFPIIFQAFQKPSWRTTHIWSVSEGNNALFIGLKISAKFSYRADNRKMSDTDMEADISCIPNGNIPAEDYEEIRLLPLPSAFQWHARALLTPKSPLQRDMDDHFHLELTCEPFDTRYAYRYTPIKHFLVVFAGLRSLLVECASAGDVLWLWMCFLQLLLRQYKHFCCSALVSADF